MTAEHDATGRLIRIRDSRGRVIYQIRSNAALELEALWGRNQTARTHVMTEWRQK